jgi:hypothetical protein
MVKDPFRGEPTLASSLKPLQPRRLVTIVIVIVIDILSTTGRPQLASTSVDGRFESRRRKICKVTWPGRLCCDAVAAELHPSTR